MAGFRMAETWRILHWILVWKVILCIILTTGKVPISEGETFPVAETFHEKTIINSDNSGLLAVSTFLTLGIRNNQRRQILEHRSRRKIFDCISNNPGISFRELARYSKLSTGTLRYHLERLIQKGIISLVTCPTGIAYFPAGRSLSSLEQRVMKNMRNSTRRGIIISLMEEKVCTRNEIAVWIGVSPSAISWHIVKLQKDGIVIRERKGKNVTFCLAKDVPGILTSHNLI